MALSDTKLHYRIRWYDTDGTTLLGTLTEEEMLSLTEFRDSDLEFCTIPSSTLSFDVVSDDFEELPVKTRILFDCYTDPNDIYHSTLASSSWYVTRCEKSGKDRWEVETTDFIGHLEQLGPFPGNVYQNAQLVTVFADICGQQGADVVAGEPAWMLVSPASNVKFYGAIPSMDRREALCKVLAYTGYWYSRIGGNVNRYYAYFCPVDPHVQYFDKNAEYGWQDYNTKIVSDDATGVTVTKRALDYNAVMTRKLYYTTQSVSASNILTLEDEIFPAGRERFISWSEPYSNVTVDTSLSGITLSHITPYSAILTSATDQHGTVAIKGRKYKAEQTGTVCRYTMPSTGTPKFLEIEDNVWDTGFTCGNGLACVDNQISLDTEVQFQIAASDITVNFGTTPVQRHDVQPHTQLQLWKVYSDVMHGRYAYYLKVKSVEVDYGLYDWHYDIVAYGRKISS